MFPRSHWLWHLKVGLLCCAFICVYVRAPKSSARFIVTNSSCSLFLFALCPNNISYYLNASSSSTFCGWPGFWNWPWGILAADQVIRMILCFGKVDFMAQFNVVVHLAHHFLLEMKWHGHCYDDLALTFGPSSAPSSAPLHVYLWRSCTSSGMDLAALLQVSDSLHYLDDFITAGPPYSTQCSHNLSTSLQLYKHLKCVEPTPVLIVLSIELDSFVQVACLPANKLHILQDLICSWLPHKWSFWWELRSYNLAELTCFVWSISHAAIDKKSSS